jgi:hypothetical protein
VNGTVLENPFFTPAFMKPQQVAFIATHMHDAKANLNIPYVYGMMFLVKVPLTGDATTLTLPADPRVRVFAVSVAGNPLEATHTAAPLAEGAPVVLMSTPAGNTVFHETLTISLTSTDGTGTIRYTIDGSEPGAGSPQYTKPVVLRASATMKAAVFSKAGRPGEVSTGQFIKAEYLPVSKNTPGEPGLRCDYFEGVWNQVPDFSTMQPIRTVTVKAFEYPAGHVEDKWGARYTGFITVPKDGIYTFAVNSDDGSKLYIGSIEAVDNDGLHSAREASGAIALHAGTYPIALSYFDRGSEDCLDVMITGPDMARQRIPASMLSH